MRRSLRILLLCLVLTPTGVGAWAQPVATALDASAPPAPASGWPDWAPGAAATAAVYGSLYVVVVGVVGVLGTGITLAAPPAMVAPAMTFGIPAVTVAVMRHVVPLVVEQVPPRVLGWFGIDPAMATRGPPGATAVAAEAGR